MFVQISQMEGMIHPPSWLMALLLRKQLLLGVALATAQRCFIKITFAEDFAELVDEQIKHSQLYG